eukprot:TRINITY_DN6418_c0_g2_i5.p1 TRINITY_DN6418_c0_g2~~TRINITY_DN6418_c0_g2_i5.p1  ORF type:complete len:916 (+),score=213.50 TRINITY_DN6418_c0_g2_i5:121-2748(+)
MNQQSPIPTQSLHEHQLQQQATEQSPIRTLTHHPTMVPSSSERSTSPTSKLTMQRSYSASCLPIAGSASSQGDLQQVHHHHQQQQHQTHQHQKQPYTQPQHIVQSSSIQNSIHALAPLQLHQTPLHKESITFGNPVTLPPNTRSFSAWPFHHTQVAPSTSLSSPSTMQSPSDGQQTQSQIASPTSYRTHQAPMVSPTILNTNTNQSLTAKAAEHLSSPSTSALSQTGKAITSSPLKASSEQVPKTESPASSDKKKGHQILVQDSKYITEMTDSAVSHLSISFQTNQQSTVSPTKSVSSSARHDSESSQRHPREQPSLDHEQETKRGQTAFSKIEFGTPESTKSTLPESNDDQSKDYPLEQQSTINKLHRQSTKPSNSQSPAFSPSATPQFPPWSSTYDSNRSTPREMMAFQHPPPNYAKLTPQSSRIVKKKDGFAQTLDPSTPRIRARNSLLTKQHEIRTHYESMLDEFRQKLFAERTLRNQLHQVYDSKISELEKTLHLAEARLKSDSLEIAELKSENESIFQQMQTIQLELEEWKVMQESSCIVAVTKKDSINQLLSSLQQVAETLEKDRQDALMETRKDLEETVHFLYKCITERVPSPSSMESPSKGFLRKVAATAYHAGKVLDQTTIKNQEVRSTISVMQQDADSQQQISVLQKIIDDQLTYTMYLSSEIDRLHLREKARQHAFDKLCFNQTEYDLILSEAASCPSAGASGSAQIVGVATNRVDVGGEIHRERKDSVEILHELQASNRFLRQRLENEIAQKELLLENKTLLERGVLKEIKSISETAALSFQLEALIRSLSENDKKLRDSMNEGLRIMHRDQESQSRRLKDETRVRQQIQVCTRPYKQVRQALREIVDKYFFLSKFPQRFIV